MYEEREEDEKQIVDTIKFSIGADKKVSENLDKQKVIINLSGGNTAKDVKWLGVGVFNPRGLQKLTKSTK